MFRLILGGIYLVLFLVLGLPAMGIEYIVKKFNNHAGDIAALRTVQWGFKCEMAICGVKVHYEGLENISSDRDKPVLYVGNHNSIFDIIILYTVFKERTGFIAKDSIKKVPILSVWMTKLYCLFLDRKDMKQGLKTILTAIDYVKNGISIFVFPEGTRSKDGNLLSFKSGPFKIATKTGCPIVPVAIKNTAEIMENHMPRITPQDVYITFGKPIYINELNSEDKKHIGDYFHNILNTMLQDN